MANVKNFGLVGVGGTVQLGKAGPQVVASGGQFYFKNASQAADVAIEAASLSASTGGVSLTSNSGTFTIGGDTTLSRAAAGIFQLGGTGAVVVPAGTTVQQPASQIAGMFRYNTSLGYMEYSNGTSWVEVATGGSTVSTATNLAGGTAGQVPYQVSPGVTGFTGPGTLGQVLTSNGTSAPTYTAVVNSLDVTPTGLTSGAATTGALTLGGILNPAHGGTGVNNGTFTTTLAGNFATGVGSVTLNADVGGTSTVTLPASGTLATVGNTVASFSGGTTGLLPSSATTGAVTLSGTLAIANGGTGQTTAAAAFNALAPTTTAGDIIYNNGTTNTRLAVGTTGQALVVSTGEPSWAAIVNSIAGGTGITPSASTGAVTLSLSTNLQQLSGLTATPGFVVQTAAGVFTTEAITGTAGNIVVTNGDGAAGSATINLATVTQGATGSLVKVTLDTFGRVTGNAAVTQGDLTGVIGTYYLPEAGGSMTGTITMDGVHTVTGLPNPTGSTDAANKAYVDAVASSLNVHAPVATATAPLATDTQFAAATYANGTAGVGATLTATTNVVLGTVGGYAGLTVGTRVLVDSYTNVSTPTYIANGIYVVTSLGVAGTSPWILTRASDYDNSIAGEVRAGDFTFVQEGTYASSGWVQNSVGTNTNPLDATIIGTDPITFVQFSGAGTYAAGEGLLLTGTTFSVKEGAGIASLPTGEVGVDLYSPSSNALILTTDGTTRSTLTNAQLALLLPAGSGLTQDTTGLYIPAAGVTNAMLQHPSFTLDADTGTQTISLGGTMNIFGTANRITTALTAPGGIETFNVDIASTYAGQTSITTLGTVTTGTWNGSTVGVAYGGTGLTATPLNGQIDIGNGTGFTRTTLTAGTGVTITNGAGSITIAADSTALVTSFSGGTTGLTPATASHGAITLGGTLATTNGGTGLASFVANEVFYAGSTSTMSQSANFTFDGTSTLSVGGAAPLTINGATGTITATATNGNINLVPNGTGSVVIGPAGAGLIQSDAGQSLTVTGSSVLTLSSTGTTTGNGVNVGLDTGTAAKLSITGPTATNYATGLAANDIPNVQYVTNAIATGASSGAIKSYTATVPLNANGTTNIGSALPANAIVVQVKVNVTVADTGATLTVGTSGTPAAYMTSGENDAQAIGLYVAETYVLDATGTQIIATVASSAATGGSTCTVMVEYKVA